MQSRRSAVFLINLVQDVNILRPLVFMASRDFALNALLLVSTKFCGRDLFGIWQRELEEISSQTGASLRYFSSDWEAHQALNREGLIFAASESYLPNHVTTHSVFRHAPPSYLKITLQHGFECVGFRHSADHVRAHGATASFGADLICAWQVPRHLTSMASSQRPKLLVTGPTAVLQSPTGPVERVDDAPGIVCENLHSVRLNGAGDFRGEFVEAFADFCEFLDDAGRRVVLRPHPGGQYVLKNGVPLPPNASINNAPMYRVDLRAYRYGISAPSSVLIDMLLARIPTAVWRDAAGGMDTDNYDGLTTVCSPREWLEFSNDAHANPEPFLASQQRFLDAQEMPLAPEDVFGRFAELFQAARRMDVRPTGSVVERERLLFVANANVPTLQLSFEKPLAPLVARGEITSELLTEAEIRELLVSGADVETLDESVRRRLDRFDPTAIIFCRYSGPAYESIVAWAHANQVPIIYHLDDDLLSIPVDIGQRKFELHNSPERIAAVQFLLTSANLVYASTERLKKRLQDYFAGLRIIAGGIYCSGAVIRRPSPRAARKIGYMASADHAHNLQMVLPAIERLMEIDPDVQFELFGSIPVPAELKRFGARVTSAPPIADYGSFLEEFAAREWSVGICPLVPIDFNLMKANTKWVEYTSCGVAVVASRGTVYDECCAGDCGILALTEEEWFEALRALTKDDEARLGMVSRAQEKLQCQYHVGKLREQVLDILEAARQAVHPSTNEAQQENLVCQTA